PYYLESQRRAAAGFAAVDQAARRLGGAPMGPFELMDLIGLDVNLAITKSLYEACGRPERFRPPQLQQRLVELGQLGRKAGNGFYSYREGRPEGENPRALALVGQGERISAEAAWRGIVAALIAEAVLVRDEGVAGVADIDTAVRLAMNFPKGPFQWRAENPSLDAR
ncbi:MAG: 3-hydroxybutyryl-CoA dehydrogenase, partial [Elusimicrobia bacterium]|nr:3-hydroxybutyryl-CoA dehydrogenase [Elusimicrobiota bacterium]